MGTYPRSGFRSGGTSECTLVPVVVLGEHPPKPPFWKTTLLSTADNLCNHLRKSQAWEQEYKHLVALTRRDWAWGCLGLVIRMFFYTKRESPSVPHPLNIHAALL